MPDYILTPDNHQRSLAVSPGDSIVLRLPENPGTGFRWLANAEPSGGLVPSADNFEQPGPTLPGAAGQRVLAFHANLPGSYVLRAKLWREWEGDRSVTARYEFPIVVESR